MIFSLKSILTVSTHSRPKAAGDELHPRPAGVQVSTHSRPKAAGTAVLDQSTVAKFQHTAARRRLGIFLVA